jgi:hypothetical protein
MWLVASRASFCPRRCVGAQPADLGITLFERSSAFRFAGVRALAPTLTLNGECGRQMTVDAPLIPVCQTVGVAIGGERVEGGC